MIDQLTVFLANERGRLAFVCRTLAQADVNIYALFVADTEDFGVARLLCDRPRAAAEALQVAGLRASCLPVVAVHVPDRPGGLASLLELLDEHGVNVEYAYCISSSRETAVDILKVEDGLATEKLLAEAGYDLVSPGSLYELD